MSNRYETYGSDFYTAQAGGSRTSADAVVPLLIKWLRPDSVVDLGCGVGTWLASFASHGVADIRGYDGEWVRADQLQIPSEAFMATDLTRPVEADRRFSLAISLEVAEHLPAQAAVTLVDSLVGLSDVVVFSAAVPGQEGVNHVNLQWPQYWHRLFERKGWKCFDVVRPAIWHHEDVETWYQRNCFVYCSRDYVSIERLRLLSQSNRMRRLRVRSRRVAYLMRTLLRSSANSTARKKE
jgi:hypothetical protein